MGTKGKMGGRVNLRSPLPVTGIIYANGTVVTLQYARPFYSCAMNILGFQRRLLDAGRLS